jgi:hypothetical protein
VLAAFACALVAPGASHAAKLAPRLGRTIVVAPVSGRVLVRKARSPTLLLLTTRQVIPLGSTVDTTKGSVKLLTASDVAGKVQSGVFNGGAFTVTQERSSQTDLTLVGGRSRRTACLKAGRDLVATAASLNATVLRSLHGHAHGMFRTSGKYGAATVRGTDWTTQDRCAGTEIVAHIGKVVTQAVGAPLTFPISPGVTAEYRCAPSGMPPITSAYCVALISTNIRATVNGKSVNEVFWAAGVITRSTQQSIDFCATGPRRTSCTTFPLSPPDRFGYEEALATCVPDQGVGNYAINFRLAGVDLDGPLPYQDRLRPSVNLSCLSWLGKPQVGGHLSLVPPDLKHVNRYTLPTGAVATKIGMYVYPTGTPGTQALRGVLYADSGGVPGALLGTTDELAFHSTDAAGVYYLSFPVSLNLPPGNYWVGEIAGPQTGVAAVPYDSVPGSGDFNNNLYSAGPTNPFGPFNNDDAQVSAYLQYYVSNPS